MVQFYFLSVFFNTVGGLSLSLSTASLRSQAVKGLRDFLRDPSVSLVLGILCSVTGAFKLLVVIRGDIPVVGDFLPVVAGLAVGGTLLLERFRDPASPHRIEKKNLRKREGQGEGEGLSSGAETSSETSRVEKFFLDHKATVGLAGIIAGLVHFLFPMVLFL